MKRKNGEIPAAILDFFSSVLASKSLNSLSVSMICQETRCSRSTFYYHFPNGIPSLILEYLKLHLSNRVLEIYHLHGSRQALTFALSFINAHRELYGYIKRTFPIELLHASFDASIFNAFVLLFRDAIQHDALSVPEATVHAYATICSALVHGMMDAFLNNSPPFDLEANAVTLHSVFLAIYHDMTRPFRTLQ